MAGAEAGGLPAGEAIPELKDPLEIPGLLLAPGEDALVAWARAFPKGAATAYVRFPRGGDLPLGTLQRLARRGHIIVDAGPASPEDVLDLAVAGAAGLVAWVHEAGDVRAMADAMGEGFLVACRVPDLAKGAAIARDLHLPVLLEAPRGAEAADGLHGYRLDPKEHPLFLRRFGTWPVPAAAEPAGEPEADDPEGASEREP